jgi:hypothetical protein
MIWYGALLIGFFIYATRVPAVRGVRGELRYRAYLNLDGAWVGTLLCVFIFEPVIQSRRLSRLMNDPEAVFLYDSYFMVPSIEGAAVFGFASLALAIFVLNFDRIVGAGYNLVLTFAQWGLWLLAWGFLFLPFGLTMNHGMPRRYSDYEENWISLNHLSGIGAFLTLLSLAVLVFTVIGARIRKRPVRGRA